MKPSDLATYLNTLIRNKLKISTMIWGPPGIGKSSIVAQTAAAHQIGFIDLRLSQLAPTDLRGLPVASKGVSRWYPPEFLPRKGAGILFLDEVNLAPPTMQGMAQQLILDRRVGSYTVPQGWYIWAAGNRKEDRAAVFDMPAPLANRFLHLEVEADLESFKQYAFSHKLQEQIIAFLTFRPNLLHKFDAQQVAWPSPRSWEMASKLHQAQMDVTAAIGKAAAAEFYAYLQIYSNLPDLDRILAGNAADLPFPTEPSVCYATTIGLTMRTADAQAAYHAFHWLVNVASVEWVQMYATDAFRLMRAKGQMKKFTQWVRQSPQLQKFLDDYQAQLQDSQPQQFIVDPVLRA